MQIIGAHMIDGGEDTVEHMVATTELTGALHRQHIAGVGHHADDVLITLVVCADRAQAARRQRAAHGAEGHAALGVHDGLGELLRFTLGQVQYMEGEALCRLAADAGQAGKLLHQTL